MPVATVARPLADRVLIRPKPAADKSEGGIYLPDIAKANQFIGEVIEVGPGRKKDDGERVPMDVEVGDTVIYAKYAGTELEIEGDEFVIVKESDILAITDPN